VDGDVKMSRLRHWIGLNLHRLNTIHRDEERFYIVDPNIVKKHNWVYSGISKNNNIKIMKIRVKIINNNNNIFVPFPYVNIYINKAQKL